MVKLELQNKISGTAAVASLLAGAKTAQKALSGLSKDQQTVIEKLIEAKKPLISLYSADRHRFIQSIELKPDKYIQLEAARKAGFSLAAELRSTKTTEVALETTGDGELLLAYAEGLALSSYYFDKHKKEKEKHSLQTITLVSSKLKKREVDELQALIEGIFITRDLVNDPVSHLSAEMLAERAHDYAVEAGIKAEIFNKARIESLKMGGLLAVNAGSIDPPTFIVLEWKPKNAKNEKPLVLVGKGVVFDTGGLTLKPTPGSMDQMKSDMAGGAAVIGAMYALAKAKIPINVVGLIPATDNRPGERAIVPSDVITMCDGTTVEVLNTDAEGRLILGDALSYAKKYDPELVIDLATLTGAAARIIGQYGIIALGTAEKKDKDALEESGRMVYERLVELPLWDEYAELIKSDVADLKNVSSGPSSGAITAAKFLQHFTDYPWIHLDIAGSAYLTGTDSYRGRNATGSGVRLLFHFLKNRIA